MYNCRVLAAKRNLSISLLLKTLGVRCCLTVSVAAASGSCAGNPALPSAKSGYLSELQYCADEVNRLRASVGRPGLRRSSELESFAAAAIERDATLRIPHYHFQATGGGGISRAETEILWWRGYTVRRVIELGLAQMWVVGPGGEHYDILTGPYTEIGCGVFESRGEVSVAQEFR